MKKEEKLRELIILERRLWKIKHQLEDMD